MCQWVMSSAGTIHTSVLAAVASAQLKKKIEGGGAR